MKNDDTPKRAPVPSGKRPYQKPAFKHECAFETMALTCGKVSTTQGQCSLNQKNS
jgi:hypothetical protein